MDTAASVQAGEALPTLAQPIRATRLLCTQAQTLQSDCQHVDAGCRAQGQRENCRLQRTAQSNILLCTLWYRGTVQAQDKSLTASSKPPHTESFPCLHPNSHFYFSGCSQMMANKGLSECFALSKQQQSDSTNCPAVASPDIP